MPDLVPHQLQVIQALRTHLEGINPTNEDPAYFANGLPPQPYSLDLRGKVFIGRTTLGNDVKMPALSILEAPVPNTSLHSGEQGLKKREEWKLLLQGFAQEDMQNPTVPAYQLRAMVEMRLARLILENQGLAVYKDEYLLSGLVQRVILNQGVVRPPEEKVSSTAFFYIPLVIVLATNSANPYKRAG